MRAPPTIVTEDLRDFPAVDLEPFGVEAVDTDSLVLAQVDLHPHEVMASLDAMASRRRGEPKTRAEIIDSLARPLPHAMEALRRHI